MLARELRSRGIDAHVAYFYERGGLRQDFMEAAIRLHRLDQRSGRLWRVVAVRKVVREISPDIIHSCLFEADLVASVVALLTRVPVVTTWASTGHNVSDFKSRRRRLGQAAVQLTEILSARSVSRFHSVTEEVSRKVAPRLRVPARRIVVIPRGRDLEKLGVRTEKRRLAVRETLKVSARQPVVLACARHEFVKGLDVLLEAALLVRRSHPQLLILIAGRTGAETDSLTSFTREHRLDNIWFLGERDDVADLLVAADCFVCPSRLEGAGGALMEAMALRCPIIASDLPTLHEAARPSEARYVPVADASALAAAIIDVIDDSPAAAERAANAYEHFLTSFTMDSVTDSVLAFYSDVIGVTGFPPMQSQC